MVKLKYDKKKKQWETLDPKSKEGFYLDGKLKEKLDNIKNIIKKNWDAVFIIDGKERIGKSTLGLSCAYYLTDTKLSINHVCAGSKDAINKLEKLPDKSLMLIDEGSLMFSSMDVMKRENRRLNKILNVIGQKNMIMIIVAPSFFDLSKYISVKRSLFLLHCYADKSMNRGRFAYFSTDRKRALYGIGKKNFDSYQKPHSSFIGRYTDFNPLGDKYLQTKKLSLFEALKEEKETPQFSKREFRKELVKNNEELSGKEKLTTKQLSKLFKVSEKTINRDIGECL